MTPTTSATASQARDDDVEERGDGTDDCLEDAGDAVHDGHEAVADCAKERFDLIAVSFLKAENLHKSKG
jgi:hypothetical protein